MTEKTVNRFWTMPPLPPKGRRLRWFLIRLAFLVAVAVVTLMVVGAINKNRLIFYPVAEIWESPKQYGLNFEEIWLKTKDGDSVKAWRLRSADRRGPTVILLQGNAGNMSMMTGRMITMYQMGLTVVSVDYPGYGESSGRPSEEGAYQAAEALWQLVAADGVLPEEIIIYGFSLGGGVASWLAAEHPPAALVLDSTFTRLRDVPSRHLPLLTPVFFLILGNAFDTQARLARDIKCPLLVVHSPEDRVVPYELGRELFEAYRSGPKEMVAGVGDHTDFLINQTAYAAGIQRLLDRRAAAASGSAPDDIQAPEVGP